MSTLPLLTDNRSEQLTVPAINMNLQQPTIDPNIYPATTSNAVTTQNIYPATTYNADTTTQNIYPATTSNAATTAQNIYPTTISNADTTQKVNLPEEVGPVCNKGAVPWPVIIVSVIGGGIVIYTAVAPGISSDRRTFGVILITLWTLVWALILWVMWKECHHPATWWLLLIPLVLEILFFILIILLDLGSG